jgi:fumarate reductase subunit C
MYLLCYLRAAVRGAHARWGVVDFRANPHVVALRSVADIDGIQLENTKLTY